MQRFAPLSITCALGIGAVLAACGGGGTASSSLPGVVAVAPSVPPAVVGTTTEAPNVGAALLDDRPASSGHPIAPAGTIAAAGTTVVLKCGNVAKLAGPCSQTLSLPAPAGYKATISVPSGLGSLALTSSLRNLSPTQLLGATSLFYVMATAKTAVTLKGIPGFALVLPASVSGQLRIAALQGAKWALVEGPVKVAKSQAAFAPTPGTIALRVGQTQYLALYQGAIASPTPVPTIAPTPVPTPMPTTAPTPVPTTAPTPVPTTAPTVAPNPCASSNLAGAATRLPAYTVRDAKSGRLIHQFLPRSRFRSGRLHRTAFDSAKNMICHGGPIQPNPAVYLVFWGDAWNDTSAQGGDPNGLQKATMINFSRALIGSRWLNTTSQYVDPLNTHVGSIGAFGTLSIAGTPPAVPEYSDLATVAARAEASIGDHSMNANYVVLTPRGIAPDGFNVQYCAWHSLFYDPNGNPVPFTNMPYVADANVNCGANSVTPGPAGVADGVSIVFGHELAESMTDPRLDAWYDSTGGTGEIGDKCAWQNLQANTYAGNFPTQPLWDNTTSSCVQFF